MAEPIPEENESQLAATLLDVWMRRRWLAVDCLMVPAAAALAVAVFLPNIYRAAALVEVEHVVQPGSAQADPNAPTIEGQLQRLNEENLSRSHLQTLISRFDLYPQIRAKGTMEGAVDQMRHDVTIDIKDAEHVWGHSTVAFQVAYRGGNPDRVSEVANALANFYVEKSQEQGEEEAKSAVAGLQAQVDDAKTRLDSQEKAVNDFLSSHLQELPDQVRVNLSALDRLNTQLSSLNRSGRRSSMAAMAARDQLSTAPSTTEEPDAEMVRLTDELNELRGRVTDQYPDVVHLKQQIAALAAAQRHHAQPAARTSTSAMPMQDEPVFETRSLEDQKRALRATIAATEAKIYSAPKREQELQSLLAPLAATRVQYNSLLEKLDDAHRGDSAVKQHEFDPFRILDPAVPSRAAAGPGRLKIAGAGVIFAIVLSLLAVFLAEKLDTTFHSLDELRRFTRVPVLASVPNIVSPEDTARSRRRARWAAALVTAAAVASVAASYALVHDNEPLVWMLTRGHA